MYANRVAIIWLIYVTNSDELGVTEVDRYAVNGREAGTNLYCPNGITGDERSHAHDHVTAKFTGARAGDIGLIHRYILAFGYIAYF